MCQALGEYKNEQSDKSLSKCNLQSDGNLPWSLTGGRCGLKILNLSLAGMYAGVRTG